MILIVGLGNPGIEYQKTRHNTGFMALDEFAKTYEFPPFKLSRKHASLISEGILSLSKELLRQAKDTPKIILAKPQTFMNNSGKAVASLDRLSFAKLSLSKELIVIHDDIDIPLGKVKISKGSGAAGHKGVESIIQSLGTKDFTRIRIGIQPAKGKPENVEDFVLQTFRKPELPLLQSAIQESVACLTTNSELI